MTVLSARSSPRADAGAHVVAPRLLDGFWVGATLVTNVGGVILVGTHMSTGLPGPLGLILLVIPPALLWWRRRFPTLVLVGCVVVSWTYLFSGEPDGPVYGPMIVALVSAVHEGARPAAYTVAVGTVATQLIGLVLSGDEGPSLASTGGVGAWLAFLLALGELLRHRQALRDARHQRLLASLDAQADQLRREAAEQRLALARELHDVLGHQLAVINIQAKAGARLYATGAKGTREALAAVQEASKQALDDVQGFLDALHEPAEEATPAPAPTLGDLETLLTPARAAGLDVSTEVSGVPRRIPAPQDLAASRVVLESLTNVLRHAGLPRTWVRIDYAADQLTVQVDNDAPTPRGPAATPGGGRGIEGLRERIVTHGGTLTTGPTNEHAWSVVAVLPLPKE